MKHQHYRKKGRGTTYRRIVFLLGICCLLAILGMSIELLHNDGILQNNNISELESREFVFSPDDNAVKKININLNDKTVTIVNSNTNEGANEESDHSTNQIADESDKTKAVSSQPSSGIENNADETEWYLTLVNKWNEMPSDYKIKLTELSNGQSVDKRILPMLQEMFDAARADNIYPIVASGYRTAKKQQEIFDKKIEEYKSYGYSNEDAETEAKKWVAVPGTSEHQLGLAVDINADGVHSYGQEVYKWLEKNAHLYGFICRYPMEKTELTGVANEPWHYRYVGVDAATEIHNKGICLEEYLD